VRTDLFDFDLPEQAIALEPVSPRDAARLLVVRPPRALEDRFVRDLPALLQPGDALVLNDTRVIRAALRGERARGENRATIDFNLHRRLDESRWRAFARPAKRLAVGDRVRFGHDGRVCLLGTLDATIAAVGEAGEVELSFSLQGAYLDEAIAALGDPPLPPYIAGKRAVVEEDAERYQTVYARREGAVAAPTAGLHFTDRLFSALEAHGVSRHFVTLHVGAGTFLPVKAEDTAEHRMHPEWGEVSAETAAALNAVRASGGRVVAVGTTALRLLETAAAHASPTTAVPSPLVGEGQGGGDGRTSAVESPPTPSPSARRVEDAPSARWGGESARCAPVATIYPFAGETQLFIAPGYNFKAVDLLLTNFHLPRSTLFMLVAAFSGLDVMQHAYAHAIRSGYRFYSYGDACLLHPAQRRA
jgi:S-adenosylmethionine:tRNA ribosyltransferase-isomerase